MSNNIEHTTKLLDTYYKKRKPERSRDKKLDRFLNAGNWKKYERRRKRLFPDFDQIIKSAANEYLEKTKSCIADNEKLSALTLSICSNNSITINKKLASCDTALKKTKSVIGDGSSKVKTAKAKIDSISKIIRNIELKRPQGDGAFTNLAKALGKTQSLKKKGNNSLKFIQTKIGVSEKQQQKLMTAKQQLKDASILNTDLQKKIKTHHTELALIKKDVPKLTNAEPENILNGGLLEKLNTLEEIQKLKSIKDQSEKIRVDINKLDIRFTATTITAENKNELDAIIAFEKNASIEWLTVSTKKTVGFRDTNLYYAYYDGIKIYATSHKATRRDATSKILKHNLNKGYKFIDKKGGFREIENVGWCRYDDFYTQKQKERDDYLVKYKKWLKVQYAKMLLLRGQKKLDRIIGILSQAGKVIKQFNKKNPLTISTLNKKPIFETMSGEIVCPHELIAPLRSWIELTEKGIKNVLKESDSNENAGSLYSDIDWNTRLKVPQYRTQSDNLISPESTCAPTTFTMMAERAGWSRADIITAIEKRFTNQRATDLAHTWEKKGKAFFKWINKNGSKNYQKVRAGKIGSAKFNELAKSFKQFGQYEDLTTFYHYLINSSSKTTINSNEIYNKKLRQGLENDGDFGRAGSYTYEIIRGKRLFAVSAIRKRIKKHLDQGDVVMFSIYHKGAKSVGTHNYYVQSINHKGFVIDDPFGKQNTKYKRKKGVIFDLYMEEGDAVIWHRKNYTYKNTPDFTGKDYTKEKAQQLTKSESRGNTSLLSWEMLNDSDQGMISYIVIWKKKN